MLSEESVLRSVNKSSERAIIQYRKECSIIY